ncbi:hypothetical protein PR003_g13460 [Phytophthora rubi]|uniref:RanBP2-type domain-containing protein n=1 Tax=Phytophthora rubi TaxID=129364 RepID=A0A6A4FHA9_9STRA|nr:hypothetical protein PR003_g13460 [Phytophthora rubi]
MLSKPGAVLSEAARAARIESAVAAAVEELVDRVERQVLHDPEPSTEDALARAGLTLSDEDDDNWMCTLCTCRNSHDIFDCWSCNTSRTENAAATNHATTSPEDEIYYRIYGKFYSSGKVTVNAKYATTKQTWHVARICQRREEALGTQYYVLWIARCPMNRRYYKRSWEPREVLMADGFASEIDLVDRWKASGEPKFETFWRQDDFGKRSIGANMTGLCMINALKRAAELAGRPDIVTQLDIDTFVADELKYNERDLTKGTSWKVVLRFLRRLRDEGRDFIFKAIEKDNFAIAGRRGARVMEEVPLRNGIYLVAAYGHTFVGHFFVLTVQGKTRRIYDLQEGKPIESAEGLINFYAFIRSFIVCKKK